MDLSLFYLPTYRQGFAPNLAAFYDEMTESVRLADRLGWARVVVSEHHFHYYGGAVPNPAVMLAAWARETTRIRLGAGVALVPLRHPLQVAEDYALLDQVSHGRCDLGISRGFAPHEFEAFGVDPGETADRVAEALQVISRFWAGEPFAFEGRFIRFARIDPWPKPVQRELPLWIAASNDRASFERAGGGGFGLLMNQYPMSFENLCEKHRWFTDAYERSGRELARRRSSVAFMAYLADTEERAIEEARGALQEHVTAFRNVQTRNHWDRDYEGDVSTLLQMCDSGDVRDVFRHRTLICTPQQAVERLSKYVDEGFNEAMLLCRFGSLSARQCLRTIERFTTEVQPFLSGSRRSPS